MDFEWSPRDGAALGIEKQTIGKSRGHGPEIRNSPDHDALDGIDW